MPSPRATRSKSLPIMYWSVLRFAVPASGDDPVVLGTDIFRKF
ncbi:MAG: hypothetical protein WDM81_01670 [Rhizomicrobium sp.]